MHKDDDLNDSSRNNDTDIENDMQCPFLLDVYCSNGRIALMNACANGNLAIVKFVFFDAN